MYFATHGNNRLHIHTLTHSCLFLEMTHDDCDFAAWCIPTLVIKTGARSTIPNILTTVSMFDGFELYAPQTPDFRIRSIPDQEEFNVHKSALRTSEVFRSLPESCFLPGKKY